MDGMATEWYLRMRFTEAGVDPSDIERLVRDLCGEKAPPDLNLLHNLPEPRQRRDLDLSGTMYLPDLGQSERLSSRRPAARGQFE